MVLGYEDPDRSRFHESTQMIFLVPSLLLLIEEKLKADGMQIIESSWARVF